MEANDIRLLRSKAYTYSFNASHLTIKMGDAYIKVLKLACRIGLCTFGDLYDHHTPELQVLIKCEDELQNVRARQRLHNTDNKR